MIQFGLTASGESGDGEGPCPALLASEFTSMQSHKAWLCPTAICCGSQPEGQSGHLAKELWILGDIICPLSCPRLCMQPMPLWLLHFQKQKNLQNIFWESLQVIPSPLSAGPGCLIMTNCSMLSSSLAPRYTKNPRLLLQMFKKGVVLDASHPTSKIRSIWPSVFFKALLIYSQSLGRLMTQ